MVLGIMQPYLFPYIGYFQLINAVDKFVFYDDVNFIKQGWINRNKILLNGNEYLFTVPLKNISSFKKINEMEIDQKNYNQWKLKFYKSINTAYKNAPNHKEVFGLINKVLNDAVTTIAELAIKSVSAVCDFLSLHKTFVYTSVNYNNNHLKSQERVIDICLQEKASKYINPVGGNFLYSKKDFLEKGIEANFIRCENTSYNQFFKNFIPNLSIIDVLMYNSHKQIKEMLTQCVLL